MVQMFVNHPFVENIDNQRIKYYKEGNQHGLHTDGHQMIFHRPIIKDVEKDNPNGDDYYLIFGPLAESGRAAADFGNTHFLNMCILVPTVCFQSHHMPTRMLMAMNPKKEQSLLAVVR